MAASDLGLNADKVVGRVLELSAAAPAAFADAAKATEVAQLRSELPARLTDLVAERASRCARLCIQTPPS